MRESERIDELEYAGKLGEARDLAVALAEAAEPAAAALLFARASELAIYADGPERGHEVGKRAVAAAEQSGEAAAMTAAYLALARVHLRIHTDSALADAEAALVSAGDAGSDDLRATAAKLRGLLAARRGRPRQALDYFAAAYQLADGNPALRARVLLTWAVQLRNWGLFADAQRRAERSLEIRLELEDHYGAAMCYGVLAFIYQRQGLWARERDALVADLRECDRLGGTADTPGVHGRLAGALVGLGKYAGAWSEAERAIELESERIDCAEFSDEVATRVHGYAWREQARVCLAQGRLAEGIALVTRAANVFGRLGDGYGEALCRLSAAELALAELSAGDAGAAARIEAALAAARPVFVRLGAVPEAVETLLIEVAVAERAGNGEEGARRIVQQVLPMLQQAGLGSSQLFRRAAEVAERVAPAVALERVVTQASMLRSLAAIVVETDPQDATVIAARVGAEAPAMSFARAAVDRGAVVLWPNSTVAVAVFLGDRHAERSAALLAELGEVATATATGAVDLEHMWPAGFRACGAAVDRALSELAHRDGRKAE